jgi:hypothetical protein
VKRPLAPRVGAENVICASGTGFFCASVTVTASRIEKGVPAIVDCVEPTPVVSLAGLPARFEREKLTGVTVGAPPLPALSFPPAPPLETAAVAVNDPAVLFAVKSGELATPFAPVVAVAWAPPPAKLALALELVPHVLAPPEPSVNVTVVPATGLPPASRTVTCSGWG